MNKILACFFTTVLIISSIYSQEGKKNVQIKNFKDKYAGDLSIQWDKLSGGPKRIIGNNIYLKSNIVNKTNIIALTREFIIENGDLLKGISKNSIL